MTATCLITNCRNSAPSGEAMCAKHRPAPITMTLGFDAKSGRITVDGEPCGASAIDDILGDAIKQAYLSGYNSGFYSAGNYFPEQSWERYRRVAPNA